MDINFGVTNQIITRTDNNKVVNWSDDYLRLCFDFKTDDWTGTSKFILIHTADDVYRIALTDDKFVVPEQLITSQKLVFSVYGVTGSYRITTPRVLLHLLIAGYDENTSQLNVDEFTNDVVEAVYIAIAEKVSTQDIVDNLTSNDTDKPLSAKQGKVLQDSKANSTHNHDDRYYTESEVDALLVAKDNQIIVEGDKPVIQTGDTLTLKAYVKKNGVPVYNERVEFYIEEDDEVISDE